ncbi:NUDIX hydrolase [Alicyclobacillus macrosporangiidus]|uniref:NUDIX hydrolase n=1 Tax=Alicyclobacillus macrosporangiidus TaxID=392015 RepID=UPI00068F6790|nr:NUDIX domain-containing protein [Alicyclobacillus macrosporangiidus]
MTQEDERDERPDDPGRLVDELAEGQRARSTVVPRPAATLMLVRDGAHGIEVLAVRRASTMRFLPGHLAFPGGALEPADDAPPAGVCFGQVRGPELPRTAYAIAAVRECAEETGWVCAAVTPEGTSCVALPSAQRDALLNHRITFWDVLKALRTGIDLSRLRYVGRWITPAHQPVRFDTRFFVGLAPDRVIPSAHAAEHDWAGWRPATDLLGALQRGEAQAVRPTWAMLQGIAACRSAEEAFNTLWVPGPTG